MALVYADFNNGDTLLDIRNKLNTFNNSVVANIDTIEELQSYWYNKVQGTSTTSSTFSPLNSLTVLNAPTGVYEYKFSMTFNYNKTTRSAYFRFSTDGGVSWTEVRKEAKDVTDNYPVFYAFPKQHTSGDINLVVEYRTEADGDVLNVYFMDIVVERKA